MGVGLGILRIFIGLEGACFRCLAERSEAERSGGGFVGGSEATWGKFI